MDSEHDERMEAADRTWRSYEIQGVDPPETSSDEWRERFNYNLEKIRDE